MANLRTASAANVNPMATLRDQQNRRRQVDANSGRHATFECVCKSTGTGHFLQPDAVLFDSPFVQLPQIYYGHFIEGSQLSGTVLPSITGGVFKWVQDSHGFFLGAQVYYVVSGAGGADIVVDHHFSFSGVAIKDVPAHLLDH